jgi:glycosyltransferase involved in cell wall biosynthesis
MKILIVVNQSKAISNFWTVLIRQMRKAGHEVLCCAPAGDSTAEAALQKLGVRMLSYPLDRKGLNPLRDMATFMALLRLFYREKADLVFTSTIKPVIYGCMAARIAGIPHIYATITGLGYAFEADSFFKKCIRWLGCLLYRIALAGTEGVFFQNDADRQVFLDAKILSPAARILQARGTGVDTVRFAPRPFPNYSQTANGAKLDGAPVFLLIARLLQAKGLPEYAAAARQLRMRHPEARFQLLGPPEKGLGSISLQQVQSWQDEGCIEYLGQTDDVRPHIAAAHVLVLPSWREGTPTCIMEGMSMGRPAVLTDVPGCREVVQDGINGRMVPLGDVEALARAMESFILDPPSIARMGAAGRQLALQEFDAEKVAARILKDMHVPTHEA